MRTGMSPVAILAMMVIGLIFAIVGVVLLMNRQQMMGQFLVAVGIMDMLIGAYFTTRVMR